MTMTGEAAQPASPVLRSWPADRVERWQLDRILPYPRNARVHSDEQIEQVAALMLRFGVTTPVLVDEQGVLIYGHGRKRGAQLLVGRGHEQFAELPVVQALGWSDDEKNAYRLADNQVALNASWDVPLLSSEIKSLQLAEFDLPLLGFDALKIVEFVAGIPGAPGASPAGGDGESAERELTTDEQVTLNKAWLAVVGEWRDMIAAAADRGFASTSYTRANLRVFFLRALFHGYDIPRAATLAYTGHRLHISGEQHSISDLFKLKMSIEAAPGMLQSIQWMCQGRPIIDRMLNSTHPIHGHRIPGEFPAKLARDLYDEFVREPGGAVLDPCHGWGGRMLGFLLSRNVSSYHGFEVDPLTRAGVRAMFDDLKSSCAIAKTAKLELKPFEDAKLPAAAYDFALTSPPYYDVEQYGGEQSSWQRYPSFDEWVAGFYRPMIAKVAHALKPGGVFALQIGNQSYPLESTAIAIAGELALVHEGTRTTGMINNLRATDDERGEVTVLLRKQRDGEIVKPKPAPAKPSASSAEDPALKYGTLL